MKLTREQIENMPAGREMDKLVMEWVTNFTVDDNFYIPSYSTDIAAAWEVVEKINQMITDGHLTLKNNYNYLTLEFLGDNSGYAVSFDCIVDDSEWYERGNIEKYKYAARADTAPLAICRAALIAMMDIAQ